MCDMNYYVNLFNEFLFTKFDKTAFKHKFIRTKFTIKYIHLALFFFKDQYLLEIELVHS